MIESLPSTQKIKQILFALFFVLLPTQLGKHFWPDFAFVAGQRVDYLSTTLYMTDIIIFLCIVVSFKSLRKIPAFFIASMFLFLAIGIYFSINPFSGWYTCLKLLEYIFFGYSLVLFLKEKKDNKNFLLPFLAVSVVYESVIAIFQFFLQHSLNGFFYFLGERNFSGSTPGIANASIHGQLILRPYATFSHPNVLAGFLLITMLLIFSIFWGNRNSNSKYYLYPTLLVGTIALVLTLSRGAILLWMAILVIMSCWIFLKKFGLKVSLAIAFLVVVISASFFDSSLLFSRFTQISLSDESVVQRIVLATIAWKMFASHIIFGIGFGNFLTNSPIFLPPQSSISLLQPVHNIFLLILSETGIVGLFFSLWFVLQAYKHVIGSLKKEGKVTSSGSLLIAFSSMLALGMFDHYFLTLQQGQLLLVCLFAFCFAS